MTRTSMHAAARELDELLARVEQDDAEFLIVRNGHPVARLIPVAADATEDSGARRRTRNLPDHKMRLAIEAAVDASHWVAHSRTRS